MTQKLHAFVDESGDRGFTCHATDYFVMSALIIRDEDLPVAQTLLAELRAELGRRPGDPLHWQNIKFHAQRLHAAQRLGSSAFLTLSTVVFCKRAMPKGWGTAQEVYLRSLRLLLERLSWFARDRRPSRVLSYTLAYIPRFKLRTLRRFEKLVEGWNTQVAWEHLDPKGGTLDQPKRVELLQLADLAASATARAFEPDRYGNTEPRYLQELAPRLYRRPPGRITSYGLKMYPNCPEALAWARDL